MRALLHNPDRLSVLRDPKGNHVEFETVSATALLSVAGRAGANEHLPILLCGAEAPQMLRDLRGLGFKGPVLVLMGECGAAQAAALLYAGADDVVTLPVDGLELAARIDAVARRMRGLAGDSIAVGDLVFFLDGRNPTLLGQEVRLSAREYDILRHLMLNTHRVVAKDALYDALYALCAMPPFDKIIEVYICKLRSKFSKAVPGAGAYIETVTGRGYRIAEPATQVA